MRESILRLIELCPICGEAYIPNIDYHECDEKEEPPVKEADSWEKGELTL
jgi:hypothetical protein